MPDRPCPKCGKPLGEDEVYRAGYEADNLRTIPLTDGRGEYCDHIPRTIACEIGSVQTGKTIWATCDVTKIVDGKPLVVSPSQFDRLVAGGVDKGSMVISKLLPAGPTE